MRRLRETLALVLAIGMLSMLAHAEGAESLSRYDIRLTLDPLEQTLDGWQQVEYVNDTGRAVDEVLFWLLGNLGAEPNPYVHPAVLDSQYAAGFDPTWTRVHRVSDASDQELPYELEACSPVLQTYSLDNGFLVVELPTAIEPDERVVINIEFETRFAHALALDNIVYRDTYVWRFGWNPIAVSPSARDGGFILPAGDYRVELTVPEEYRVFGGADQQTELRSTDGLTTYEMANSRPARSVPLVIGPDFQVVSSTWNGVDLHAVYLPGGETFARASLSYVAEILAAHSDQSGPFGYQRLLVVESPTPGFYGMAADGMILIGRSMVQLRDMPAPGFYDRFIEYLLAHEAAHLWWGFAIGTDFDAENWISEGFAEYLSITYFEDKYGAFEPNLLAHLEAGLIEDLIRGELGYLNLRQHNSEAQYVDLLRLDFDEAVIKPLADVEYQNGQVVRTYNKGYLVLRALEAIVGRDALRTALVEANEQWRGRLLSVNEFRELVEELAGIDLTAFFGDWLYGDARFDAAVEGFDTIELDGGFSTTIHLRQEDSILPVTLRATLVDGSVVEEEWMPDSSAAGDLILETASSVVSVHVDPNEMLPDANRFNNHSPRRILVEHPFRGEDAAVIGKPLDAYVLGLSPTAVSGSFRNDHAWSLTAIPHVEENAAYAGLVDVLGAWDLVGLLVADVNRDLSLSALATITALGSATGSGELDAQFTVHARRFTNPENGFAGTYWFPTTQFDLGFGARGDLAHPIPYVALALRQSEPLRLCVENSLSVRAGIPGFGTAPFATLEWAGTKRFRFAPLSYLDVSTTVGGSLLEGPPTEFMFSMDRLQAFALPPYGYNQLFGRAEISFPPLVRNAGYSILSLTRLEDVTAGAFVQGGRTWGGCDQVCESGIRFEAGVMLTFRLDAILGTSIVFSVGYAHPLLGLDGEGAFFVELE